MAKKLWEILEEEEEKNKEERVEAVQKANEQFDEYVSKKGTYDTSKHTTSMNNIIKAKKNVSKESADNFKKVNKINLGDTASSVGKNVDNLWRGLNNGIYSFRQQLERVTKDNPTNRVLTEQNNFLQEQLNKNPNDEKAKALLNNYNSFQSKLNNESEEYQNKLQEKINQNSDIITKNIDSIDNPILKKTAELAPSIGQMLPGMLPGAGPVYFAGSATGNYYTDAMNRGMSEEEAKVYSGTMGLIEGALESIGAGLTKNVGKQLLKKNIKGALINYGLDIGENFLEESIVEPISELAAQIYGGKDKADWQNIGQRMIDSGIDGALVSAITGGVSGAIGAVGSKIPKQSIYIDYNTNQKLDNKTQNILKQAENIINQNSLPVQNEQYRYTDPQLNQILNNKELPMQSYQYEKSANVKINNLRQDANKYFNNTEKARNYVNMLEKIIRDKDVEIRLDADLKTADGKIANGSYSNGVITINPNSTRTGEFIAIHELTHAIGTKDMLDMVNRYRESNAEFNSAVENLLQSYNTTELTEEALSDVSAQLFGNQEFINNLSQTNPNLFKRIYNEIKYLWHQFRGYKNQDQFIDDLKYKWEQAYKNNDTLNKTTNYSIAGKKSLENIKDNSLLHSRGINSYNNAISLAKQNIDNEQIRQKTGWFQDKNGDWKYEFSDKDMSLKNIKFQKDKTYKLGDILEHDTLFTLYPEIENYKVEINDNIKANASFDRRNNTITINSKLIKNNKSLEGTLIHEIQHAIQNIENFERGTSTKGSKLKYYNSLGEIEATETKGRFLKEKYQNKNMFPIAPESSKANPQHKDLNKYLKNRNSLDKVKDSMYNYFNKRGVNNYDVSEEIVEKDRTQNNSLVDERKRLESENNSGSFYLQKNRFDVSGNENLVNAKTLFYRTRDDGQYYVQATDGSGKITYDGVFYGEKQLARSLGEEIANKIVNTSESTNNEIYLQSDNIKSETDYMMAHRPTETGAYASNITKGTGEWDSLMPEDVYEHPEWYFDMNQEYSKESFKVLKQIKNNPNAEITIYRATTGNKINKGDWVTLSKKYAEYHNNSQFKGKGNIIELKVKAKDVQYAGDDINEFGYFPQDNTQTTDNHGRILSKEQQEYFKNSKVKDDNGQLITVYHGTNNAGFTQFNRNVNYFTDNQNVAKTYTGKDAIYEGYINITNPITIDANEEIWSKIDINNILIDGVDDVKSFLDTYGASTWKENGTIRTSTADLVSAIYDAIDEGELNADGIIINNIYDEGAYSDSVGKQLGTDFITFNSNQFKNIDNINPTDNPDIRYSQNNETWQSYLDKNYKTTGTRTNLQDVKLPTAQKQVAPTAKNNILSTGEYTKQNGMNQSNIETNSELPISENQKFRKHYKSIIQSQYTTDEAKAISKELMKTDTYVPESNNKQLERADKRIELSGADSELSSLMSRSMTGGNIKADDIAVGERLIQYYSKTGNKAKLQEAIQATAMAGTTAGQTVQAMSLLNHQTPEGQAIWLQRSVDKMNNDLVKIRGENADQFTLTPEMTEKIVNSKNTEELQNNLNEVYEELGQQVTKTNLQKIDAWRYFSMLANPRTHIRNIVGNTAMSGMQYGIKNKIAGSIESVVSKINPEIERTHTIVPASKEVKQFAKNDIKNVADRLGLNENKYNPKTRLENSMRTFKSDAMENTFGKLFELNDKALEAEDGWGLKAGYTKALSEYMTANKLTPENITDKQLAKARNYAIEQAQEATFHQTSALSTLLNQFSNKNKVTKFIMDSTLPFKKTPINVAKSGLEYSPIGLAKSAIYDTIELRKGNISVNKYIDNISKGLTGTGIALVGYALANAGILKASGSDDKDKESFDQDRGNQTYSIQIGDNTYSLDWLAPSGIPLFIGAECFEIMQTDKETKTSSSDEDSSYNQAIKSATNILDAFTNAMNPMTEMSMLSGLTSALKSYDGDNSKMLANLGVNAVKSYVNQFVPTAIGQVAKTTDEYERSTTSTKTGTLPKAIDSTKNYAMSKIPGLRQMLPTKTDIWGNELKQSNNVLQRGLENSVFPWTRKGLTTTDVDKELNNVYKNTGESSVLPNSINKNLTIDKQKYVMTSEEYAKYKKTYGTTSYNLLNSLVKSNNYKNMSDFQKQYAIEKVYDYATEQIKVDYAKNNKLEYEESKLSKTINAMKKSNANTSNYFEYLALTEDTTKNSEKIKVLTNSSFSNKSKELIYENNLLSDTDEKYPIIKSTGLNINSYLKYKLADSNNEFASDKKDDETVNGKTITNSAKNKRYNYINSISGATYTQKLILFALEYEPSSNTDKQQVINYVKTLKGKTDKEKLDILSNFKGITLYKDGTFKY